jgi:hypothetical protein
VTTDNAYADVELSIRRTLVPVIAGYLLAQAARWGLNIPADALVGVLEAITTGVYYSAVRILEVRFPQLGVLLGAMRQPRYDG